MNYSRAQDTSPCWVSEAREVCGRKVLEVPVLSSTLQGLGLQLPQGFLTSCTFQFFQEMNILGSS